FKYPTAAYEDVSGIHHQIVQKFNSQLFSCSLSHSPYDVVAWHGNYAPYKYNLLLFVPVNAVIVDHMDPSIFTVLTAKSSKPGTAIADFVLFPPNRINPALTTFRPAYFHRNVMTEFMGCISGSYDSKSSRFRPGGASLHNCLVPHGPDQSTLDREFNRDSDEPSVTADNDVSFMFETMYQLNTSHWASDKVTNIDTNYLDGWKSIPSTFKLS
ncbi:Homogentisate 1,2-dioxygenase, partial [Smittium mucronatum]